MVKLGGSEMVFKFTLTQPLEGARNDHSTSFIAESKNALREIADSIRQEDPEGRPRVHNTPVPEDNRAAVEAFAPINRLYNLNVYHFGAIPAGQPQRGGYIAVCFVHGRLGQMQFNLARNVLMIITLRSFADLTRTRPEDFRLWYKARRVTAEGTMSIVCIPKPLCHGHMMITNFVGFTQAMGASPACFRQIVVLV